MKTPFALMVTTTISSAFGNLRSIRCVDPKLTPENWFEFQPRNVSTILRQLASEFSEQLLTPACSQAVGMWTTATEPVAHIPTATTTTRVC